MPTTAPSMVTSGPPELPGLAAASNWIRLLSFCLPSGERNTRCRPEITPAEYDGPMPNGKPTATTWSPGCRSCVERMVAGIRSSGILWACSTARSFSGCAPVIDAVVSRPSANTTLIVSAVCTTCRLVRITPLSTITTPVPTPCSISSAPGLGALRYPVTRTTDGLTSAAARAAGEGSGVFSSVFSTAASMASWVSGRAAGRSASVSVNPSARVSSPMASQRARALVANPRNRCFQGGRGAIAGSVAGPAASACGAGRVLPGWGVDRL